MSKDFHQLVQRCTESRDPQDQMLYRKYSSTLIISMKPNGKIYSFALSENRVSSKTRFAFCFTKLYAKRVLLFRETNWLFCEILCFAKQPVLNVSLFLVRSSYLRDNPIFTSVYDNYNQCCGAASFLYGSGSD
jgi:hypothetical protein